MDLFRNELPGNQTHHRYVTFHNKKPMYASVHGQYHGDVYLMGSDSNRMNRILFPKEDASFLSLRRPNPLTDPPDVLPNWHPG
jgi:hypothetical protein